MVVGGAGCAVLWGALEMMYRTHTQTACNLLFLLIVQPHRLCALVIKTFWRRSCMSSCCLRTGMLPIRSSWQQDGRRYHECDAVARERNGASQGYLIGGPHAYYLQRRKRDFVKKRLYHTMTNNLLSFDTCDQPSISLPVNSVNYNHSLLSVSLCTTVSFCFMLPTQTN